MGNRGTLKVAGLALLLTFGLAGWMFYGSAQPLPAPDAEPTPTPPRATATKPGNKITTPAPSTGSVKPSTGSADVTFQITEAEATAKASDHLAQAGLPLDLKNVQIRFQNDRILAAADAKVSGFTVPVTARARLDIQAGKPKLTVEKIDFAGLGAPEPVRQQVRDAIEKGLTQAMPQDLSLVVEDVTLTNGVMTVKGHSS